MLTNATDRKTILEDDNIHSIISWALEGLDLNRETIHNKIKLMYSKEMLNKNTNLMCHN